MWLSFLTFLCFLTFSLIVQHFCKVKTYFIFLEMKLHFLTALKMFANHRFMLMLDEITSFRISREIFCSNFLKTDFTRQNLTFKILNFKKLCLHLEFRNWEMRRLYQKLKRFTSKVLWIRHAKVPLKYLVLTWNFVKTTQYLLQHNSKLSVTIKSPKNQSKTGTKQSILCKKKTVLHSKCWTITVFSDFSE